MACRNLIGLVVVTILQACSTTSVPEATSATIAEDTADSGCGSRRMLPKSDRCCVDVQSIPQRVYRWVDKEGNIYYGDSVPTEYADKAEEVQIDPCLFLRGD